MSEKIGENKGTRKGSEREMWGQQDYYIYKYIGYIRERERERENERKWDISGTVMRKDGGR